LLCFSQLVVSRVCVIRKTDRLSNLCFEGPKGFHTRIPNIYFYPAIAIVISRDQSAPRQDQIQLPGSRICRWALKHDMPTCSNHLKSIYQNPESIMFHEHVWRLGPSKARRRWFLGHSSVSSFVSQGYHCGTASTPSSPSPLPYLPGPWCSGRLGLKRALQHRKSQGQVMKEHHELQACSDAW